MRGVTRNAAVLLALALGIPSAHAGRSSERLVCNLEYELSTRLPSRAAYCYARSGDHHTGVFFRLDGGPLNCDRPMPPPHVGVMTLTGSYNTAFAASVFKSAPSPCTEADFAKANSKKLSGLHFANKSGRVCFVERPDDDVEVFVFAEGGVWPEDFGADAVGKPRIFYTASLSTSKSRLPNELPIFRRRIQNTFLGLKARQRAGCAAPSD